MSRTKIHEDKNGNASSARVIGLTVVGNALLMLWTCIVFAFIHPDMATTIIGTGIGLFSALTTTTFIYLYGNKREELRNLPNTNNDASSSDTQS